MIGGGGCCEKIINVRGKLLLLVFSTTKIVKFLSELFLNMSHGFRDIKADSESSSSVVDRMFHPPNAGDLAAMKITKVHKPNKLHLNP